MDHSIKQTYNKLASTYEKDIDHTSPYNTHYERPGMMELLPEDLTGQHVLDAGCSAGWYTEQLVRRGAEVTGIDISSDMVEAAKRRVGNQANLFAHDLQEQLPLENATFDYIVSSLTLHYIKDWSTLFAELSRVLKPGGQFIYSIHHPFLDYQHERCEDYFQEEFLTDTWEKPNITIEVSFYRRPLQEVMAHTTQHFTLEKLIEPQPIPEMKEVHEKAYEKLMKNPQFMIIKAKK